MNPLFFIAAAALLGGNRRGNRRQTKDGTPEHPLRARRKRTSPQAKAKHKVRPRRARAGNGRVRQNWTSFPWQPDRVTEVGAELLEKGVADADNLTLAVAKTIYPVHPISGDAFEWPGDKEDVGATMIWQRIHLRVNTLLAGYEERVADAAAEHATEATAAPPPPETDDDPEQGEEEAEGSDDAEGEAESEADGEDDAASPVIGRMAAPAEPMPTPVVIPSRRPLTLTPKRHMRRRTEPQFDPGAYVPPDNRLVDGVMHTVEGGETIHDISVGVLIARGIAEPSREQVAHYISLIISAPYNSGLQQTWDEEHALPGAPPYPWGAERPELWLPKLNEEKLETHGMVTTHGVTWNDGGNGINPPAGLLHWRGA